ncbi:MAG: hypothetical protein LBH56_02900 [Coriobacteriales bacterium]|nr:hypothetical protein [Coriobacteriales bacterium]
MKARRLIHRVLALLLLGISVTFSALIAAGTVALAEDIVPVGTGAEESWSVFNLFMALFNLFVALGLIARLAFLILRDDEYEQEMWERLKRPKTLEDVRNAVPLGAEFEEIDGSPACSYSGPYGPKNEVREPTRFDQFCTSACAVLALVALILFFIVERINAHAVLFNALSPLFGVISVLVLLGMFLSLLEGGRALKLRAQQEDSLRFPARDS